MFPQRRALLLIPPSVAVLVAVGLWLPATGPGFFLRLAAILLLSWLVPGALLASLWQRVGKPAAAPAAIDAPGEWVLGLGLGWCWLLLVALLLHWYPGPLVPWAPWVAHGAGVALLGAALWRAEPLHPAPVIPHHAALPLLALLLVGALLRLPGLGYHEFHVDETWVLTRAREAIRGEDDALARHTKGPGEIAVALTVYRALGTIDEGSGRLPFALASVGSILAVAVAGRRLFANPAAGWWAGLLLALNGFALGLSRIVQYQPAVLLLMVLALWSAWEFAQGGGRRWLLLAALFAACGLVMHYEVILAAPALAWLVWCGWRRAPGPTLRAMLGLGLAGTALLLAVYLPMVLNPFFATTQDYLGVRVGGFGGWNGPFFVEMSTFYNSTYFFVGLLALVAAGLVLAWRAHRRAAITLTLWFGAAFVLHFIVMRYPGTHFYVMMPAWSLLGGLALARGLGALPRGPLRGIALALVGGWVALSAGYLYLAFFRQTPEYVINYATERVPLYWAPYGLNIPEKPRFGLPLREGWRALGVLNEWHYIGERYASNDRSRHLRWYLSGFERADRGEAPDWLFVATHPQEPDPTFDPTLVSQYHPAGEVRVRGEVRIRLFTREPLMGTPLMLDEADFERPFQTTVASLSGWRGPTRIPLNVQAGDSLRMVHLELPQQRVEPGEQLTLLVRWEPLAALPDLIRVVQLGGESPIATLQGPPGLGLVATSSLTPGEAFDDAIMLPIPRSAPPGSYPLRLQWLAPDGTPLPLSNGTTWLELGTVRVR